MTAGVSRRPQNTRSHFAVSQDIDPPVPLKEQPFLQHCATLMLLSDLVKGSVRVLGAGTQ